MSQEIVAKKGDKWLVPFTLTELHPNNPRFIIKNIPELAEDIKNNGINTVLMAKKKDGKWQITRGQRRWTACKMLYEKEGIEIIMPICMEEKDISDEMLFLRNIKSNTGTDLNPIELAASVQQFVNWGWQYPVIAKGLGISEQYVRNLYKLRQAPMILQNFVIDEIITGTLAIEYILKGPEAVSDLIAQLTSKQAPSPLETENSSEENEEETAPTHPKKITKKDLTQSVNSFKAFKKFAARADVIPDNIPSAKKEAWNILLKIINNEITAEQIEQYFYFKTENDD